AGIRKGDRIIQINDTPIIQWRDLSREIGNSKGDTCRFIIERQGETMAFLIQPKTQYSQGPNGEISSKYIIGINAVTVPAPRGFLRSVGSATFWTIRMMRMVVVMVHGLLTGDISLKLLAGPLGIAQGSGHSFREGGVSELIRYLALISVNLGAVNLFPIPLLDGGWLFIFLLYEAIRRKPLSQKVQERLMQAGFVFLILLFLVITYNDIGRILDIQSIDQIMAAKKK
ncbi:MAG: RIP metalloprotease RseP, partial [Candidatus Hydrogenedentota bacterium]